MLRQETITWCSAILTLFVLYILINDYHLYKEIQNESNDNIEITVKAVMEDHLMAYIFTPLSQRLMNFTNFVYYLPFITANHISYLGVIFALIGARLVLSDDLQVRRLGVIAFLFRQFMDELDGNVARHHLGIDIKKQVSLHKSSGYFVDGICDGIGTVAFWYGAYCKRKNNPYKSLEIGNQKDAKIRPSGKYYLLLLTQIGLSSLFWNIFLIQYHQTLDPSVEDGFKKRSPLQEEIFKSSLMFLIMWLWRCFNPHAICNYFLLSIWMDKTDYWTKLSSRYFFYIIISLSFLCIVHLTDIKYQLS